MHNATTIRSRVVGLALTLILISNATTFGQELRSLSQLDLSQVQFTGTFLEPDLQFAVTPEAIPTFRFSCGLTVQEHAENPHFYFRPPKPIRSEGTGKRQGDAVINVSYTGFTAEAEAAFQRAVDTWSALLEDDSQTINVSAEFTDLCTPYGLPTGCGILGAAGASMGYFSGFGGLGIPGNTAGVMIIGMPLGEKISGSNANGTSADITTQFNSTYANFHFGEGAPGGMLDFESVVLHELGHGLEFAGLIYYDDGNSSNGTECGGTAGNACQFFSYGSGSTIRLWNSFSEDNGGTRIWNGTYPDGSSLGSAVTGSLFFDGTEATSANGSTRPALYTPGTYASGSSFSHLDETTFNGSLDNLMTPFLSAGELARRPGPVHCGMGLDMGWDLNTDNCSTNLIRLPVELASFEAGISQDDIVLTWVTATEDDNAGFDVEHKYGSGSFEVVGFVEGVGRSIEEQTYSYVLRDANPGRHTFRLNQIDFDGTSAHSYEVEVDIELPGGYTLNPAYPNPFNPSTTVTFQVGSRQYLELAVFDVQGRMVDRPYASHTSANELQSVRIDGSELPSGVYLVRLQGEDFVTTRQIILSK